jgi:hypothetical protein
MIGLDGRIYGTCILFPANSFFCSVGFVTIDGGRKFRCLTQFSAGQIAGARKRGLNTLDQLAAEYNITGAIGPHKPQVTAKTEGRRWTA